MLTQRPFQYTVGQLYGESLQCESWKISGPAQSCRTKGAA